MIYKNSIKILFSNFNLVWKMVLYFFLFFFAIGVLVYLCVNPVIQMIDHAGFFARVVDLYTEMLTTVNIADTFANFSVLVEDCFQFILDNMSSMWFSFLGVALVVFFVNTVGLNLSSMASCVSLHLYMGSMTKQGFFASFSENFGKNLKVQLCYYFVTLPLKVLYVGIFVLSLRLFRINWYVGILAFFVIIIGFVLLYALKTTMFVSWIPTMVVMNYGVFKSLKVGFKNSFRLFNRVFGSAIGVVITIMAANLFFGIFTFATGLLISIPMSYLFYSVFGMVVVYESQGMRYYVDICNVTTPKKKEISDKFKDMKNII